MIKCRAFPAMTTFVVLDFGDLAFVTMLDLLFQWPTVRAFDFRSVPRSSVLSLGCN